jgi:hypothetical protein
MADKDPLHRIRPVIEDTLPPGIIVMGPYRCATSFLSHVLSGRGVNFGPQHELYAADKWNPYGYFQRPDILQANDDFVASAGHSTFAPADLLTLRARGKVEHLQRVNLDWRYGGGIWGIKDPRFCTTLMSWYEAGLLGENVGLIRVHREQIDSARSLLQHPQLVAQLDDASLETALQVILRYDQLADEQQRCFPGPLLSLNFEDLIRETSTGKTDLCIKAIDRFIDFLIASRMTSASTRDPAMAPR